MTQYESPSISLTRRGHGAGADTHCTVVWVRGEHDLATSGELGAMLVCAAQLDAGDVLVDLSGVTFMDASIVGTLVGARNRQAIRSRSLEVRAPSSAATAVLELCDMTHLVRATPPLIACSAGATSALGTWVEVPTRPTGAQPAAVYLVGKDATQRAMAADGD